MASATHLLVMTAIIKGKMNDRPPVSSNMITTSVTVILMTPARNAPAPTMAYSPGMMQSPSEMQKALTEECLNK